MSVETQKKEVAECLILICKNIAKINDLCMENEMGFPGYYILMTFATMMKDPDEAERRSLTQFMNNEDMKAVMILKEFFDGRERSKREKEKKGGPPHEEEKKD